MQYLHRLTEGDGFTVNKLYPVIETHDAPDGDLEVIRNDNGEKSLAQGLDNWQPLPEPPR